MTGKLPMGQLPQVQLPWGQLPWGQLPHRTIVLEPFLLDNIRNLTLNHIFMYLWTCKGCNVRSDCLYKIRFKLLIISLHIANPSLYKPKYSTQTLIQNFKLCFMLKSFNAPTCFLGKTLRYNLKTRTDRAYNGIGIGC